MSNTKPVRVLQEFTSTVILHGMSSKSSSPSTTDTKTRKPRKRQIYDREFFVKSGRKGNYTRYARLSDDERRESTVPATFRRVEATKGRERAIEVVELRWGKDKALELMQRFGLL